MRQTRVPSHSQTSPSNFSKRKRALFTSLSTRRRFPSLLVRKFLTISSCSSSSTQGRELTIKKKGWSPSKLPALTREVSSSLRPSKGNEKSSLSHPLKQEENSIQVTLGKRRQLLSRRELLHLLVSLHLNLKQTEESSLRVIMDRAPPVFKSTV